MQPKQFGSWNEQKSSNGRIYYYNTTTEVSQWSKPTEWQEYDDELKGQNHLQSDRDMQASVVMPPLNFFPPPPPPFQFFPPHPMVGYQYPADVYQPYPTPPSFIPWSAPAQQFAVPTLPVSKQDRPSTHVVRNSSSQSQCQPHDASTSHVTSTSSKQQNESYSKPHPYSVPRTSGITESAQPSTSTATHMGFSAVTANGMANTPRSIPKNDVPLCQQGEKRPISESNITPGELAVKKARPDMILGPDWQLQPWARFYKPELAKKLREEFNNDQPKEMEEDSGRFIGLERKFFEQLKNIKNAAASTAIMKNKLAVEEIETEIVQGYRITLEADVLQREAAFAEEEQRSGPGLRRRARYLERIGRLPSDNIP